MSSKKPVDMRETISALVDGEVSDWELRKALQPSPEENDFDSYRDGYRKDWAAYQTIGAVLRKERVKGIDLSRSIMEAVDDEVAHTKVGYLGRSFSQAAVAASVAVVALIGIQQYQAAQVDVVGPTSVAEIAVQAEPAPHIQAPVGFEFQPVTRPVSSSFSEPVLRPGTAVQIPVDRNQLQAHLEGLVQEHSEHSVNSSQDVLPMVRIPASSEAE